MSAIKKCTTDEDKNRAGASDCSIIGQIIYIYIYISKYYLLGPPKPLNPIIADMAAASSGFSGSKSSSFEACIADAARASSYGTDEIAVVY